MGQLKVKGVTTLIWQHLLAVIVFASVTLAHTDAVLVTVLSDPETEPLEATVNAGLFGGCTTMNVYAVFPPVAVKALPAGNATPLSRHKLLGQRICSTVMTYKQQTGPDEPPKLSVAVTHTDAEKAGPLGVPDTTPVVELRVRPAGSACPPVTANVMPGAKLVPVTA